MSFEDVVGAFVVWTPVIGLFLTIALKRPAKYRQVYPKIVATVLGIFALVITYGIGWTQGSRCEFTECEEPRILYVCIILAVIMFSALLISPLADSEDDQPPKDDGAVSSGD